MDSNGKRGYFDLLPVDSLISYEGATLMVRAVWGGGVVCKDGQGEVVTIEGPTALDFIERV